MEINNSKQDKDSLYALKQVLLNQLLMDNKINIQEYNLVLNRLKEEYDTDNKKLKYSKKDDNILHYSIKLACLTALKKENMITEKEYKIVLVKIKKEHRIF